LSQDLRHFSLEELRSRKEELEQNISYYNSRQIGIKLGINSAYGSFSNKYFRWFDLRLAEGVTLSGQLATMFVEKRLNQYLNEYLGTADKDYIIYCDTDSMYANLEDVILKNRIEDDKDKVEFLHQFCKNELQAVINQGTKDITTYMNSHQNQLSAKRESIAEAGAWTGKKRYFLSVWDMEGVRYTKPEIKITGLEAVRSSTPEIARNFMKESIPLFIKGDEKVFHKFVKDCKDKFFASPFENVAFPRGVNGLGKYSVGKDGYSKGCPVHVRASILYNKILRDKKLATKFPLIAEGDKIKFCYLTLPNPLNENIIAAPGILPREVGLDKYIDYKTQFEKVFLEPIQRICESFGWTTEERATLDDFF
jgi:DNA polymerase elongation subunit (family B)